MVYLLNMMIFHGYVGHNQMVIYKVVPSSSANLVYNSSGFMVDIGRYYLQFLWLEKTNKHHWGAFACQLESETIRGGYFRQGAARIHIPRSFPST